MIKEALRAYITAHLIRDPNYPLQDDEALITGGLIDSFSLVELALFVGENFGVHLDEVEMTAENMDTLESIVALVESRIE